MPDAGEHRPALVWRSLPLRFALAAPPTFLTLAVLLFSTPWRLKLLVGAVAGLTIASPSYGLLLAATLTPLGHLLATLIDLDTFRITEAVVVAFLAGWLLRANDDRPGPHVPRSLGWLLALVVAVSVAAQAWDLGQYRGELGGTFELLFYAYYFIADRIGFIAGARLIEGIALVAAAVTLFRRHPRLATQLPVALATSAVLAATSSVLLWRGIAPASVLARYAQIGYRVSAHVPDVNAAGSYIVMVLCLTLGAAARARGERRVWWLAAALPIAVGLWFSESRTALAAAAIVIALAATWLFASRWSLSVRIAVLSIVIVSAIGLGAARARLLETDPTYRGAGFRSQFNAASLRMVAARPALGVGVGQYYRHSALFMPPQLAFTYGYENAHNYFLQIAGELGLIGLLLFVAWIGAGLARAARALVVAPRDARLLGVSAGIVAIAGTCLTGHPLLLDEVAFPFWMQFGLMLGLAGSVLRNREPTEAAAKAMPPAPRALSVTTAIAAAVIVVAAPLDARRGAVGPPASAAVDGFYGWDTTDDGMRFRWTGQYGSVFVPANVTRVYIPVRMPARIPGLTPIGIEVRTSGIDRGRSLIGDEWANLNVVLPDVAPPIRYKRIDLRVDRTWQPGVYLPGSSDMRPLGIQVGEVRLFHEY